MKALLIVDIQNDFLPGGSLAVNEGNDIIPIVNKLMENNFDLIIATKDWHPAAHSSFAENHGKKPGERMTIEGIEQILWPIHCVQESFGAEFSNLLNQNKIQNIFYKGSDKNIDSYSAFFDNAHKRSTGLNEFLRKKNIKDIYIVGLATDYCVKYSALDALKLGFNVIIIRDAVRGVNLNPLDSHYAFKEMEQEGARIEDSSGII